MRGGGAFKGELRKIDPKTQAPDIRKYIRSGSNDKKNDSKTKEGRYMYNENKRKWDLAHMIWDQRMVLQIGLLFERTGVEIYGFYS